jgi:hypothetical protein
MPEPLKLEVLSCPIGHGFLKGWNMAVTIHVRGLEVLVFIHNLELYVMLPDIDLEANDIVIRSEKDILNEMKEEFGRELKGVKFFTSALH